MRNGMFTCNIRYIYAGQFALKLDVQYRKLNPTLAQVFDRCLPGHAHRNDLVAALFHEISNVAGNEKLILDDQNAQTATHRSTPTVTRVPGQFSSMLTVPSICCANR